MTTLVARFAIPKPSGNVFSMCARTARLGGVIGMTGFLGTQVLIKPAVQCQGYISPIVRYI